MLKVSRSGYYAWLVRPESAHALEDDIHVSPKRVVRLMQEQGLEARPRKRFRRSVVNDHDQPVAANLLKREFTAAAPSQRWVGDTTEFVIAMSQSASANSP